MKTNNLLKIITILVSSSFLYCADGGESPTLAAEEVAEVEPSTFSSEFEVVEGVRTFVMKPNGDTFFLSSGRSNPRYNYPSTFFPCFPETAMTAERLREHAKHIPKCRPKGDWLTHFLQICKEKTLLFKKNQKTPSHFLPGLPIEIVSSKETMVSLGKIEKIEFKNNFVQISLETEMNLNLHTEVSSWGGWRPLEIKYLDEDGCTLHYHFLCDEEPVLEFIQFLTKFSDWSQVQVSSSLGGKVWESPAFKWLREFVNNNDFSENGFVRRKEPIKIISKVKDGSDIREYFEDPSVKQGRNPQEGCVIC